MQKREKLIEERNRAQKLEQKQISLEKKFLSELDRSITKECFRYEEKVFGSAITRSIILIDNELWIKGREKIYINGGYDKTLKVYFELAEFSQKDLEKSIGFSSLEEFKSTQSTKITLDAPKDCRFKLGDIVCYSCDDKFEIILKRTYPGLKSEKWQENFDEERTRTDYENGGKMKVIGFAGEKILLIHDSYDRKFSLVSDSDLIPQQEINDIIFRSFKDVEKDSSEENRRYYDWKILGINDKGQYLKYRGGASIDVYEVEISGKG